MAGDGWGSLRSFVAVLEQIIEEGRACDLEAFLRDLGVDETLEVREDTGGGRTQYCRHVPLAQRASSGTRVLVGLFCAFEVCPSGALFLLDDFDAHLHTSQAERLVGSLAGLRLSRSYSRHTRRVP